MGGHGRHIHALEFQVIESTGNEKAHESRLRRTAHRNGYALQKSRIRDPWIPGYGCYRIVDTATNLLAAGGAGNGYSMTLDEVEHWLTDDPDATS